MTQQPPAGDVRAHYPHWAQFQTRWNDNDVYGHVNNTVHYVAMDTVINAWMIDRCGLDIEAGSIIGLCVESSCRYHASATYPETIDVGLRIGKLGTTSVVWETALVGAERSLLAEGRFVHVFVDRDTRRPVPLPDTMRGPMATLLATAAGSG